MNTERRIEDFGEKIGGARKDLRGRLRAEDLAAGTPEEVSKWATKDYIWPTPDYEELGEGLADEERNYVLRAVKLLRDALPANPPSSDPARVTAYVAAVATLRDAFAAVKTRRDLLLVWDKPEVKTNVAMVTVREIEGSGQFLLANLSTSQRWLTVSSAYYGDGGLPTAIDAGLNGRIPPRSVLGREMRLNPRWPQKSDVIDRRLSKERLGVDVGLNGRWRLTYSGVALDDRVEATYIDYLSRRHPLLAAAFARSKGQGWELRTEARDALRAPFEIQVKSKTDEKRAAREAQRASILEVEGATQARVIDWLDGRAASSADYIGAEGLRMRAGEFGNWVNEKERQALLDAAYNGFRDLADALALAPDGVSLNGTLAVAFGARGSGPFAGHYESGRRVVNLTKPHGFGVLAHEWGHAFDHWAGVQVAKYPRLHFLHPSSAEPFLSDRVMALEAPPSSRAHYKWELSEEEAALLELADAMFHLKFQDTSPKTPEAYRELIADKHAKNRADIAKHLGPADAPPPDTFVNQITSQVVTHLVNEEERRLRKTTGDYPSSAQLIEMRRRYGEAALKPAMALAVDVKEGLNKRVGCGDVTFNAADFIAHLRERYRRDLPVRPLFTWLEKYTAYFAWHHNKAAGELQVFNHIGRLPGPTYEPTAFATGLRKLTEYYQRPHEAFARAVETAVAQSLRAKERRSQFLVPIAAADGGKGHPSGEDAAKFTQAFLAVVPKLNLRAPRIVSDVENALPGVSTPAPLRAASI